MRFGAGLWCLQATAGNPRHHTTVYRQFAEDARLLDDLGYEGMWLSEHHFFYDGYCPAPLTAASAALAVTTRLRVGTGMLLLPMQNPDRVAAQAAAVSQASGGRLDVGVGLGYRDVEFDSKGVPRVERVKRQAAGLEALQRIAVPAGAEIWNGSATPAGVARAGARGQGILLSGANPLPLVRELASAHRTGWAAAGSPGGVRPPVAALRNVWITDDPAEKAAVLDWQRASYVLYAGLGWSVAARESVPAMDFKTDADTAVADAVATTIIGPAGAIVDGLHDVAEAGVDYVVFRVVIEGAPQAALHHVLTRLANEVLPEMATVEAKA